MYLKYSILIHNGLGIINFSSIIGRRNLIFVPIDFSVWNKDFCIPYEPYLKVWFSVLFLVLSIIFIKVLDGYGFELFFLSAQDVNFCVSLISLGQQRWKLSLTMCFKYSILIQHGLVNIDFSSIIGLRSLIFVPIDLSV